LLSWLILTRSDSDHHYILITSKLKAANNTSFLFGGQSVKAVFDAALGTGDIPKLTLPVSVCTPADSSAWPDGGLEACC
jgi:hypothetical protein